MRILSHVEATWDNMAREGEMNTLDLVASLASVFTIARNARRRRLQIRAISRLDDRCLNDIGIGRSDLF